ncbi:MAG TPA: SIS domain-containing protein [Candidatus Dormibacteraeota bacterium]|jgi:D-sedoheptulose 7-phosphate isomerase|nr:SIS domain-containing protein [Candidatus Dormibacteraeota bacterium]
MSETGRDAFSQLLYPMLSPQPPATAELLAELSVAPRDKSAESNRLRQVLLAESEDEIVVCAEAMAARFLAGGRLLCCGNGGSATAAADIVAEYLFPTAPHRPVAALSLTNDVAVVTAVANDVSFDDIFVRQVIALGRPGDVVLGVSTSGNSENVLRGQREARRRGMLTVGLAGYDGGRMAHDNALDHCFVVRSSSVHRIQEVQTTLYHVLWELVQRFMEEPACA